MSSTQPPRSSPSVRKSSRRSQARRRPLKPLKISARGLFCLISLSVLRCASRTSRCSRRICNSSRVSGNNTSAKSSKSNDAGVVPTPCTSITRTRSPAPKCVESTRRNTRLASRACWSPPSGSRNATSAFWQAFQRGNAARGSGVFISHLACRPRPLNTTIDGLGKPWSSQKKCRRVTC
ncbi:hypothetical protein D3C78_1463170 [compost metagenome]